MQSEPQPALVRAIATAVSRKPRFRLSLLAVAALTAGCQMPATPPSEHAPEWLEPIVIPDIGLRTQPTPAPPEDLWQRMRLGFDLPDSDLSADAARRVEAQVQRYTRTPVYVQRISERAERYLYHVIEEVERRGLPAELALVPVVESALDPFAYSHGQAAGLWQFIPSTGRKFGLQQDWWQDQRRDLVASTTAALDYLESLHAQFDGDWLLALAAYNAGPGNVRRAMRHARNAGQPLDFFNLTRLPAETRAYIPRILALRSLIMEPSAHGIVLPPVTNAAYFASVDTGGQIDLDLAAELAGIDARELYLLNPALSRWATHPEGPHRLLLPQEAIPRFKEGLAEVEPDARVAWKRHRVQPGESLSVIAAQHGTDLATLRQINELNGSMIRAGQDLLIPTARGQQQAYTLSQDQRAADRSERQRGNGRQALEHQVSAGESFWTIARKYGVGVRELAQWNGMATGDPLVVGRTLKVWMPADASTEALTLPVRDTVTRPVDYRVRQGDSLARIATRFDVPVRDLVAWNELDPERHLQPGQRLRLYVSVTGGR